MKFLVTAALLALTLSASWAADMPKRKPGLWEMKIDNTGTPNPATDMTQCVDENTDSEMQKHAAQGGMPGKQECEQRSFTRTPSGWEMDSVCKMAQSVATTHAVANGDFNSGYTVDSSTRFNPPMRGQNEINHRITLRWLGACPAGMAPGTVTVNGRSFNPAEVQKRRAEMAGKLTPEQRKQMLELMKKQGATQ